jgi:ubiquinone/menaquinone biosynthesis C-methylase UbiE
VYVAHETLWNNINYCHRELLSELIPKNCKVLDAGCGYGRWANQFTNYTGIDFSPDFIEKARKKYPKKTFIIGKLEQIPFDDGEFDWAFCVSIKKMVQDNLGEEKWQEMLAELKRVAKKVLILEYEDYKHYEIL